ncbi:TPA: lpg1717 family Dot/Icm T4SS effector [Legionella pneumophila]|uniref:lpg1717 family Dot/Icm T4SS effector n=1 Tax=Legionella pneumophila TaxID=446 RepID=UPI0013750798|nr:lpg1717 family Dot/Icm T4SS effector [Legionella pneumophila]HAT8831030.1 lpg1717 family Dot/Icm T4SS effector [Legionella pneumophila subsp. pneumophila]HAT1989750.1 lpg1717 family Dot/Icm T4SS effector [Legionella pneumophila]HAT1992632.1 lpg1717 family Dot/Icm T4SS effector [Legionella pneumophila]HAT2050377.1 lpg1717 family Dot/Icm T4SS effector [Legionella pneumophila]HAT2059216.1 lpg1717 family Dot/Icm T4SS effector [Legionella pneumophila]
MPVRYSGFDYDGCVGVTNLINIVAQNPKLIQRIRETSNYYTKEVALIASNRQSDRDDKRNARSNGNGSCFIQIQKLCIDLGMEFDPFLLADAYNLVPAGTSLHEATNPANGGKIQNGWLHDKSKTSLVYAHMQRASSLEAREQIDYFFYDDREDILEGLYQFFSENPELIPSNVRMHLVKYACSRENVHTMDNYKIPVQGKGFTNPDYVKTIKAFGDKAIENARDVYDIDGKEINAAGVRQAKYNCNFEFEANKLQPMKFVNNFNSPAELIKAHEQAIEKIKLDAFELYKAKINVITTLSNEQKVFLIRAKAQQWNVLCDEGQWNNPIFTLQAIMAEKSDRFFLPQYAFTAKMLIKNYQEARENRKDGSRFWEQINAFIKSMNALKDPMRNAQSIFEVFKKNSYSVKAVDGFVKKVVEVMNALMDKYPQHSTTEMVVCWRILESNLQKMVNFLSLVDRLITIYRGCTTAGPNFNKILTVVREALEEMKMITESGDNYSTTLIDLDKVITAANNRLESLTYPKEYSTKNFHSQESYKVVGAYLCMQSQLVPKLDTKASTALAI